VPRSEGAAETPRGRAKLIAPGSCASNADISAFSEGVGLRSTGLPEANKLLCGQCAAKAAEKEEMNDISFLKVRKETKQMAARIPRYSRCTSF